MKVWIMTPMDKKKCERWKYINLRNKMYDKKKSPLKIAGGHSNEYLVLISSYKQNVQNKKRLLHLHKDVNRHRHTHTTHTRTHSLSHKQTQAMW